jgi:Heavy metal binding domain
VLCDDAFLGALCSLRAPGFDIAAPRRYNTIMRIGTAAWTIALGGLCIIAPSDALGPADLLSGVATVEAAPIDPSKDPVYICPMDPDVRSHAPGKCRRCGMALQAGIPDPVEFHLDVAALPEHLTPGQPAALQFFIHDPWKDRPVTAYNLVHEKLFHAFVVSEDLQFFQHSHPTLVGNGVFQLPITFPHAGMFRVLGDFYPSGATPQLNAQTIFVPGSAPAPVRLTRDYSTKSAENMRVALETIPQQPIAGNRTQMRFRIEPGSGLEKYLGAWAHMLAASNDLIDLMHEHPYRVDEGPMVEFEITFPRPMAYRTWVQFQRNGIVNTVHFDVEVAAQPADTEGTEKTEK